MSGESRVVVVAGAAGGLGLAVAKKLLAEGAGVISIDRSTPAIPSPEEGTFSHVAGDVRDPKAWARVVEEAKHVHGGPRIDGLVNMSGGSIFPDTVLTQTDEGWRELIGTALDGTWLGMRAVLPSMLAAGRGSVVSVSSAGLARPPAGHAAYLSAKGAVEALTLQAAREYAAQGVRFNVVAPGPIRTALYDKLDDAVKAGILAGVPMGRPGRPEDVAAAVSFLLSGEAEYVTGATLTVDGGYTIG